MYTKLLETPVLTFLIRTFIQVSLFDEQRSNDPKNDPVIRMKQKPLITRILTETAVIETH